MPTCTVNILPSGSGSVTGGGTYDEGSIVTLTATPSTNYRFRRYYDSSNTITTSSTYSFTMPDSDVTINARFIADLWNQDTLSYTSSTNILSTDGKTLADVAEYTSTRSQYKSITDNTLTLETGYNLYGVACSAAAATTITIDDSKMPSSGTYTCKVIIVKSNSTSYTVTFGVRSGSGQTIVFNPSLTATGTYIYNLIKIGTQWTVTQDNFQSTQIVLP